VLQTAHEYSSRKKDALNIQHVKKEGDGFPLSTWINEGSACLIFSLFLSKKSISPCAPEAF
jgi:hypothetical protein